MQTNVIGISQFADGGVLASKHNAASANYINKMSDYCGSCVYKQPECIGEKAYLENEGKRERDFHDLFVCQVHGISLFNFFYWDFLARHRDRLKSQGRMSPILRHLKRISAEEIQKIHQEAAN